MKLTNEFEVSASIHAVWELLGDLSAVLSMLPGVEVTGSSRDEVFARAHIGTDSGAGEFYGVARTVELDKSRHLMRFEVYPLQMPRGDEPLAVITLRAESARPGTAVTVEAEKAETDKTDFGTVSERWAQTMTQFAAALHFRLAEGKRHAPGELPRIAQLMASYGANGVVRLFLTALGLATGHPYLPRGPVDFYGPTPQDPKSTDPKST
jgi:hypothetical protein